MKVPRMVLQDTEFAMFIQDIERSLLLYIAVMMKGKELSLSKARLEVKAYLSLMPVQTREDLLDKLSLLSWKYREIALVFLKYGGLVYEQKTKNEIEKLREKLSEIVSLRTCEGGCILRGGEKDEL